VRCLDYLSLGGYFLCHYPFAEDGFTLPDEKIEHLHDIFLKEGCHTLIHGHVHNHEIDPQDGIKRLNVCVDSAPLNYAPLRAPGELERLLEGYFCELCQGKF